MAVTNGSARAIIRACRLDITREILRHRTLFLTISSCQSDLKRTLISSLDLGGHHSTVCFMSDTLTALLSLGGQGHGARMTASAGTSPEGGPPGHRAVPGLDQKLLLKRQMSSGPTNTDRLRHSLSLTRGRGRSTAEQLGSAPGAARQALRPLRA